MAQYYAPLPAYRPGPGINLEPVNSALDTIMRQNDIDKQIALQQQASNRADQSLALQKQTTADAHKVAGVQYGQLLAKASGGIAQMAANETDPTKKASIMSTLYNLHPEYRANLTSYGVDPNDSDAAAKFIMAEAAGYQNPLDVAAKQAAIDASRASTSLNKQKLDLAKRQFDFTSSLINGANGRPAASPAGPNVGDIDSGYRFKGGNPADPNSWEPVQ